MRLIDADELPEVNTIERIEGDREVFVNNWIPAAAIWEAPTVEAIPIGWIANYLQKIADDDDEMPQTASIGNMLTVWLMLKLDTKDRKENEID